jgi:hypothetical protein
MLVRLEQIKGEDDLFLVVDEINRYIGKVIGFHFAECMADTEAIEEDGYVFWTVDKKCLNEILLK